MKLHIGALHFHLLTAEGPSLPDLMLDDLRWS